MDCEAFFRAVEEYVGEHCEPTQTETGGQCAVDFFHPRVRERLGTGGVAAQFNRSGVVWVPAARRLGVKLRVPAAHDDAVAGALAAAPLAFDRTDHRGVPGPDCEVVTVLHYAAHEEGVTADGVDATLAAVAAALSV